MKRSLLGLVAILALLVPLSAPAGTTATKLVGTTGPGFTITLKKGSAKVAKLPHGKYTITVNDKSSMHDFALQGPGMNKKITTVPFKGTKTVTLTLKRGSYTYYCTPHRALGMKGTFKVT